MARPTKRSPKRDDLFFQALAADGVVGRACELAGYARFSVYDYRRKDPEFRQRWAEALERSTERLEAEAFRRANEGHSSYVVSNGRVVHLEVYKRDSEGNIVVGTDGKPIILERKPLVERKHSDTLMIFLLKARRPEKYRDRFDLNVGPKAEPTAEELSDTELMDLIRRDNAAPESD